MLLAIGSIPAILSEILSIVSMISSITNTLASIAHNFFSLPKTLIDTSAVVSGCFTPVNLAY
jgi:hypothetical protein